MIWLENVAFNPTAVFDSDSIAYFNAVTTPFSASRQLLINQLVLQLKADGNWTKLDRLWLLANEASDQGLVSLVNPASTKIAAVNSPTFTVDQGYQSNGSTSYLDSKFNDLSSGVNYTQNGNSVGVYSRTNAMGAFPVELGVSNASTNGTIVQAGYTGNHVFAINNCIVANALIYTSTDSRGMFSTIRTASNAQSTWKNGVVQTSNSGASIALQNADIFLLCLNNNGSASNFSDKQIGYAFIGSGSVDQLKMYNAMQTYMTAIGANV